MVTGCPACHSPVVSAHWRKEYISICNTLLLAVAAVNVIVNFCSHSETPWSECNYVIWLLINAPSVCCVRCIGYWEMKRHIWTSCAVWHCIQMIWYWDPNWSILCSHFCCKYIVCHHIVCDILQISINIRTFCCVSFALTLLVVILSCHVFETCTHAWYYGKCMVTRPWWAFLRTFFSDFSQYWMQPPGWYSRRGSTISACCFANFTGWRLLSASPIRS